MYLKTDSLGHHEIMDGDLDDSHLGWGWSSLNPLKLAKKAVHEVTHPVDLLTDAAKTAVRWNPYTGKYSLLSVADKLPVANLSRKVYRPGSTNLF